jgi:hypothetical protein
MTSSANTGRANCDAGVINADNEVGCTVGGSETRNYTLELGTISGASYQPSRAASSWCIVDAAAHLKVTSPAH